MREILFGGRSRHLQTRLSRFRELEGHHWCSFVSHDWPSPDLRSDICCAIRSLCGLQLCFLASEVVGLGLLSSSAPAGNRSKGRRHQQLGRLEAFTTGDRYVESLSAKRDVTDIAIVTMHMSRADGSITCTITTCPSSAGNPTSSRLCFCSFTMSIDLTEPT
jgi:hypothetical protein